MGDQLNLDKKLKQDFYSLLLFVEANPIVVLAGTASRQGLQMLASDLLDSIKIELEGIASRSHMFVGFSALSMAVMASKKIESVEQLGR